MNKLSLCKRSQIIHLLVEGTSLRATARLADVNVNTVMNLLRSVGDACHEYQYMHSRNLSCTKVQIDEVWSFVGCKQKNVERLGRANNSGDCWVWVALDPDTRFIINWYVGERDSMAASEFIRDLSSRLTNRVQITSDGYKVYENTINGTFGASADYAQVVKQYDGRGRYTGSEKRIICGNPKEEDISTSLIERSNLTLRMSNRRFTRRTNGHSRKIENHAAAVNLHYMYYNYGRIHQTLRVTPAMEAGITDHAWSIEEIIRLVKEETPKSRGAYKSKLYSEMIANQIAS